MSEARKTGFDWKAVRRRARLPRVSGRFTAFVVALCLVLSAAIVLVAFRLDPVVESYIVLGVWWLVWIGVLTRMLFRGERVTDDHEWAAPRSWWPRSNGDSASLAAQLGLDGCIACGEVGEALLFLAAPLIAIVAVFGLAWVLIELAIPAVAFVMYFLVRGMIARVVNDRHRCEGSWGRSLRWGALWATIYTLPLAGLVFLMQKAFVPS